MFKPVKRLTLSQEVITQLIELIREATWKPGDKIPGELELALNFSLSRNSMREALKSLVHAGILESKPGRGTFVSANALRNIRSLELGKLLNEESFIVELLESRLIIEPQLVYIAAQRASREEIKELEFSVQKSLEAFQNNVYLVDLGFDFHRKVARISKNRFLIKYMESIEEELNYQRGLLGERRATNEELKRELFEHAEISKYIATQKAKEARQAMVSHLENAMRIFRIAQNNSGKKL